MAISEALLRYGNAHWDNLTFQSRMIFLDAYMGEMNYPLMIYEGAIKMPETIQEVSRLQGWSNEETIYTLMDFSKRMGWITKDAFDMMMMASESDAYTYAYNEGHSDSRKNEGYQPTMENQKEETRFRKILRQRAETFGAEFNVDGEDGRPLKMFVDEDSYGVTIDFEGYSVQGAERNGGVIHIENDGGNPIVRIWSDINQEDSTHRIDLQGAREENRQMEAETFAGEESWQSGVREYFGDEEMMDFYDWMQDNYNDDDDDFIEYDDPEEWRDRVHLYFGEEEMIDFYDWLNNPLLSDFPDNMDMNMDAEEDLSQGRISPAVCITCDPDLPIGHEMRGDGEIGQCSCCGYGIHIEDEGCTVMIENKPFCWSCSEYIEGDSCYFCHRNWKTGVEMDAETFEAMMMPKRYLMICPECDESVPEMDSCISCLADLSVKETPMVEVVDLEAEEGNLFSEVLIVGLCVFGVSFLLGREAHRRIKG